MTGTSRTARLARPDGRKRMTSNAGTTPAPGTDSESRDRGDVHLQAVLGGSAVMLALLALAVVLVYAVNHL